MEDGRPQLVVLSGKVAAAASDLRRKYVSWLDSAEAASVRLCDVAYTSAVGRKHFGHRLAVVASSMAELRSKLAVGRGCGGGPGGGPRRRRW